VVKSKVGRLGGMGVWLVNPSRYFDSPAPNQPSTAQRTILDYQTSPRSLIILSRQVRISESAILQCLTIFPKASWLSRESWPSTISHLKSVNTSSSSVASVSTWSGSPRRTGDPIRTSLFLLLFDLNHPHTNNCCKYPTNWTGYIWTVRTNGALKECRQL